MKSVAMAFYNGAKYIDEQIRSILDNMEESDEINACSIVVPVEFEDKTEEWLISFKNETHNHPTEIEPFGGAATCLGGAIRQCVSQVVQTLLFRWQIP